MVEEKRDIGLFILLNIITCGIYSFFFIYKLVQDMNVVCAGDGDETPGVEYYILFSILTCGIYSFYYLYKIGNRLEANGRRYNTYIQENGTTVLIWLILGSWFIGVGYFVAMYIIIKNMNTLARAYNSGAGGRNYNNPYAPNHNQGFNYSNGSNNAYSPDCNNSVFNAQTASMSNMKSFGNSISLYCKSGEFAGNSFPIYANETVIMGRDNSCNIKFDPSTPNVSRIHCAVRYDGNSVALSDQGSTYGTFLSDGRRLEKGEWVPLTNGALFYVGSKQICFCIM